MTRIRINNSILKTEERRRRFQDIHCGKFALHNLTKFRVTQFDGILHHTIWRYFQELFAENLLVDHLSNVQLFVPISITLKKKSIPKNYQGINLTGFRLFHEIYHSRRRRRRIFFPEFRLFHEIFYFEPIRNQFSGKISSHCWTFCGVDLLAPLLTVGLVDDFPFKKISSPEEDYFHEILFILRISFFAADDQ